MRNKKGKIIAAIGLTGVLLLSACASHEIPKTPSEPISTVATTPTTREVIYVNITAQEAKALMDSETGYCILDVRTAEEYAEGHIPGAVLLPYDEIEARAEEVLPDNNQMLLVYCRSGRRSKIAAESLVALGYTDIREFGGIIDWPYEIES